MNYESLYKILTPAGSFDAVFGEEFTPIEYRGDQAAIQFFKDYLFINQLSGDDGHLLDPDRLEPNELYGFCQPEGSGIVVMPPFDDFMAYSDGENEIETVLDSAMTDEEKLAYIKDQCDKFYPEKNKAIWRELTSIPPAVKVAMARRRLFERALKDRHDPEGKETQAQFFHRILKKALGQDQSQSTPIEDNMTTLALDAVSGIEKVKLAKELKTIRGGMAELSGIKKIAAIKRISEIRVVLGGKSNDPDNVYNVMDLFFNEDVSNKYSTRLGGYKRLGPNIAKAQSKVGKDIREVVLYAVDNMLSVEAATQEDNKDRIVVDRIDFNPSQYEELFSVLREAYYWASFVDTRGGWPLPHEQGDTTIEGGRSGSIDTVVIATFVDVEDNVEVRVAKIMDGYSVTIKDLDSGEVVPFGTIYPDEETAIRKAKEIAKVKETKPQATIADVNAVMPLIKQFIGKSQLAAMGSGIRGEEGQFFKDKFIEVAKVIESMPESYDTDGQGDKAVAYLHYFKDGADWYITEKDKGDPEDEKNGISGQIQAFGLADLGYGGELGYISIKELIESGVELDLYWSPKTLAAIKGKSDNDNDSGDNAQEPSTVRAIGLSLIENSNGEWTKEGENRYILERDGVKVEAYGTDPINNDPQATSAGYFLMSVWDGNAWVPPPSEIGSKSVEFFSRENPDHVSDRVHAEATRIASEYKAMTESEVELTPDISEKSAFIAELEALKSETDINAFNEKLDDIAQRIESAGLGTELDDNLNEAADRLTELLNEAEKA